MVGNLYISFSHMLHKTNNGGFISFNKWIRSQPIQNKLSTIVMFSLLYADMKLKEQDNE